MEEFYIRPAIRSDLGDIFLCVDRAYSPYVERIGRKPGPMTDDYQKLLTEGTVYVGEADGRFAGLLVMMEKDGYLLLDNIAVCPSLQGKGIGTRLIAFAERRAQERGFREVRLYTNVKMTENLRLYGNLGFREYDRHWDKGLHRVYLKKALPVRGG